MCLNMFLFIDIKLVFNVKLLIFIIVRPKNNMFLVEDLTRNSFEHHVELLHGYYKTVTVL